jgi:hypothetical protein
MAANVSSRLLKARRRVARHQILSGSRAEIHRSSAAKGTQLSGSHQA